MFNPLRAVFQHWQLKLLAIAIALAIWWGVARDPMVEIPIDVQIEFHNVPEGLEISSVNNPDLPGANGSSSGSELIPHAQVRLRGPAREMREMTRASVHPVIDLRGASAGERTYDLSTDKMSLPRGVEVLQVVPAQLHVTFDRRVTRQVEVRPRVIGALAPGYRIASTTVLPSVITIIGPERRVSAVESVITDPVDATGVMGQAVFTTRAYVSDPLVRPISAEPVRVNVVTEKSNSGAR